MEVNLESKIPKNRSEEKESENEEITINNRNK